MSKLEDTAATALDKAMKGADALAQKVAELAQQYGPQVGDAVLWAARIDAAQGLVYGGFAAVTAVILGWRVLPRAWAAWRGEMDKGYDTYSETLLVGSALVGLGSLAGAVFGSIFATIYLTNIWAWLALARPEIWIAKRVLGL